MTLAELDTHADIMLRTLRVNFKKFPAFNGITVQFIIEDFGTVVCIIDHMDYAQVSMLMEKNYSEWRKVYIATEDDLTAKKYEVIWELMKGGYIKWIRTAYKRQFNDLITMQNFGNMIINQRLKIWGDKPRYRFLIEDNVDAKKYASTAILTKEPGFFDYMPE